MDTQPPPLGGSGSNPGQLAGTTLNTAIFGTQQERRDKLVHRDAANAATKQMTWDVHLKIVRKTGCSKNHKQHEVWFKYIHNEVNSGQWTISQTAGVRGELCNQLITARNVKPPWSTKALVWTVRKIEHHDVVSSGMFPDEFHDKHSRQWTKQAVITMVEATEACMVEVIAEFQS